MDQTIKRLCAIFREFADVRMKKASIGKYFIGSVSTRSFGEFLSIEMNVYLEDKLYDYGMNFLINKSDIAIVTDSYRVIDFDFIFDNSHSFDMNSVYIVTPKPIGVHTLDTL